MAAVVVLVVGVAVVGARVGAVGLLVVAEVVGFLEVASAFPLPHLREMGTAVLSLLPALGRPTFPQGSPPLLGLSEDCFWLFDSFYGV